MVLLPNPERWTRVSARAEIIRCMLPQPSRFFVVAELAAHAAYGKDNVADALDMFSLAGVVTQTTMTTAGNQKAFRLDAGAELVVLAGPFVGRFSDGCCIRVAGPGR